MTMTFYSGLHGQNMMLSPIQWEPYNGPLPEQPHMARILDGLEKGLNFNAAAWGVSAGKSLDRLQKAVEKRCPWRKDGETIKRLRSYEVAKLSRQAMKAYSPRIEHVLDILAVDSTDGVSTHAIGTFHSSAIPYLSKQYSDAVALNGVHAGQRVLMEMAQGLTLEGSLGQFSLTSSDEVLNGFAGRLANHFSRFFASGVHFLDLETYEPVPAYLSQIRALLSDITAYLSWTADDVLDMAERYGIEPIENRLGDPVWVRRRLRSVKALKSADFYRAYGYVHKQAEPIIADQVLADRRFARARNAKTLQNTVVFNNANEDEWLTLYSVSQASVSNPELRRIEMMNRLKGFENIAKSEGYIGVFLTFTTPSRFHAYHHSGVVNQNWLDAGKPTVKDASSWLTDAWSDIRTELKDNGLRPFGFRFVEPHHDGTPHWHMVLFVRPETSDLFNEICIKHLLTDPDFDTQRQLEQWRKGEEIARYKCVKIDPNKGSAVAYCAAYVAKNLDGFGEQRTHDETGKPLPDTVARVDAWRSAHNIRQFAQIGGPSVSAWREVRRCREEFVKDSLMFSDLTEAEFYLLETIRRAADSGDWEQFVIAMGGVAVKRKDQSIRIQYGAPEALTKAYAGAVDQLFGNIENLATRYGDIAKESITGFLFTRVREQINPKYIQTRQKTWTVADKKKFLATVRDQFDVLEQYELYQRMAEEQYQKFIEQIDLAETKLEHQLMLIEKAENAEFINSLDVALWDIPHDAVGGYIPSLDQCH